MDAPLSRFQQLPQNPSLSAIWRLVLSVYISVMYTLSSISRLGGEISSLGRLFGAKKASTIECLSLWRLRLKSSNFIIGQPPVITLTPYPIL